ncbi:TPA: radical SAM protein, partial [Clostridioides difficile]|nr:radical SAM protein [Clostridioides difficile]
DSEEMIFNVEDLIIYRKNQLVIIYNKKFRKYIKLSEEIYKYFLLGQENKIKIYDFVNYFDDESDKKYIINLIDIMNKNQIFKSNNLNFDMLSNGVAIYFCLTNRCNLFCKHCCVESSSNKKDLLSTYDLKNIVDIISVLNTPHIIITGGEPLIREDFFEIIKYIKQKLPDTKLILSTNGTLIDEHNVDFIITNFEKIDISIDGVDENTCSETRGKGVFNKVISSVNLLKDNGFSNIKLSMVFGQKNSHLNKQFKDLNKKLGTEFVERYFIPTGRGLENKESYLIEDTVLPITIPYILDNELKMCKDKKNKKMGCCACNAGNSQIFINYDGDVYPCPSLIKDDYKMGNIFDNEFVKVIKENKTRDLKSLIKLESIYPYNFEKCKDCDVNIFCWHCPAILDSVKDNELELDRWCSMMKHNLNTAVWGDEKVN